MVLREPVVAAKRQYSCFPALSEGCNNTAARYMSPYGSTGPSVGLTTYAAGNSSGYKWSRSTPVVDSSVVLELPPALRDGLNTYEEESSIDIGSRASCFCGYFTYKTWTGKEDGKLRIGIVVILPHFSNRRKQCTIAGANDRLLIGGLTHKISAPPGSRPSGNSPRCTCSTLGLRSNRGRTASAGTRRERVPETALHVSVR